MCHNAWPRHACVTHGKPCVNMHGTLEGYKRGAPIQFVEHQEEKGGREKRKGGKEKRKGGKKRKRKKKREEKMEEKRKGRGKGKRKRKECHIESRPGRRRTRNCATRSRFPPTLVILRLGAT